MNTIQILIAPLLGLVGLWVGSYLTKNRELAKLRKDQVAKAYAGFVQAQSIATQPLFEISFLKLIKGEELSDQDWREISLVQKAFSEAHANVLIYGSPEVIEALSDYYDVGGGANSPEGIAAYVKLLEAMRADSHAANYPSFGHHADNIFISGPGKRRGILQQQFGADDDN